MIAFLTLTMLTFTGSAQAATTSAEYLKAPEIEIPGGIEKIIFVDYANGNNHGKSKPAEAAAKAFMNIARDAKGVTVEHVSLKDNPQLTVGDSLTLHWDTFTRLAEENGAQAVITLDRLSTRIGTTNGDIQQRKNSEGDVVNVFTSTTPVSAKSSWRYLHVETEEEVDASIDHTSSTKHYVEAGSFDEMFDAFGNVGKTATAAGASEGSWYAGRVLAAPTHVPRRYYSSGKLSDGHKRVKGSDWEGALMKWEPLTTEKGNKGMKASFNVALAHEMMGDFEKASSLLQALERGDFDKPRIREYRERLDLRIANAERLDAAGISKDLW